MRDVQRQPILNPLPRLLYDTGMRFGISWKDLALAGGVLLTAAAFALAGFFPVWPGDAAAMELALKWRNPGLTEFFRWVTFLGWFPVALGLGTAATLWLLWRGRAADGLLTGLVALSALGAPALKYLVGRPRPDYAIVETMQHLSFPSGHAAFALLLAGVLIYLAQQRIERPWLRHGLSGLLALLALLVGVSRIYLGVHWPSDVLGGYLYAGVILVAAIRIRDRIDAARENRDSTFPDVGI